MKMFKILAAILLLGSLTVDAQTILTWSWDDPVSYTNGSNIPGGDLANITLHCGMVQGGPYPATKIFEMQSPPSIEDMDFIVAGLPGSYYCVSTVDSLAYATTSGFSNEVNFTVTAGDLGLVPNPPTNLRLQ